MVTASWPELWGSRSTFRVAASGTRNKRYAAVIEDGIVTGLMLEEATGLEVSSAEAVLSALA